MIKQKAKRILLIALTAVVACAALFVFTGCKKEYKVTFSYGNGTSDVIVKVEEGETVKEPAAPTKDGYIFFGWKLKGESEVYDFTTPVTKDITLVADWTSESDTVRIRWQEEDFAEFVFDGSVPRNVKIGTKVSFKVRVSPYYEGTPVVKAGDAAISADADGNYVFTATSSVTVSVSGLSRADAVIKGLGNSRSPYLISNASQFKTFADSVNNGSDKYVDSYIKLTADIDFNGEAITPVALSEANCFTGEFDGDGHTISNFKIVSEKAIVGLFGYTATATVKNLNVKTDISYEITVKTSSVIFGGVVAYNIGSDIINCSFSGNANIINTVNDENVIVFLGGISGFMQGYNPDYTATISYCKVEGSLKSTGAYPVYAIGGVAAAIHGASVQTPASIYNSSFSGDISGKTQNAGGIVGYLRDTASVANCYVSGSIAAEINGQATNAGSIAGKCDNETALTRCVSNATVKCNFDSSADGSQNNIGGLVYKNAYNGIDKKITVLKDNYHTTDGKVSKNGVSYDVTNAGKVCELVGWDKADWTTENGKIVPLYDENAEKSIKAHFVFGESVTKTGLDGNPLTLTEDTLTASAVMPIYFCYDGGTGMNTFIADSGKISYGYYFDKELTERVPSCYLLTNDVDIYVGFANYAEVEGEYYLVLTETTSSGERSVEIRLVFDDNGKLTMSYDGIVASYMYVFDGEKIMIKDGYFAYIKYSSLASSYNLTADYYCDIEDGGNKLVIYDNVYFAKDYNRQVTASKLNNAMGTWYAADDTVYTFLSDGTGSRVNASSGVNESFTYTCNGNNVRIEFGSVTGYATISADGNSMQSSSLKLSIKKADIFKGIWESNFANKKTIDFDGKGSVKYNGKTYDYTVTDEKATFGSISAEFNDDGLLVVTDNGEKTVYGREGSYIGVWHETLLNYTMRLSGIGRYGYGTGVDTNNIQFTYIADKDDSGIITVNMYYRTRFYGMFNEATADDGSTLLYMAGYYNQTGMLIDDFNMCFEDPFKGTWNSSDGTQYEFNGFGDYDIEYTTSEGKLWKAKGSVVITKNGAEQEVRYRYDKKTATGTFTYNGTTYTVTVKGNDIVVNGITCKAPDDVSTYVYHVGDEIIEFNGKSPVGLGKAKVTLNGVSKEYDYTVTDNGKTMTAIVKNGSTELYKFVFEGGVGTVSKNGKDVTESAGLYHRIIGKKYLISGDKYFYSTKSMDMTGYAKGMFADTEVDIYYVDENYIKISIDGTDLYYIGYVDENTLALVDSSMQTAGVLTVADGYQGKYVADDGTILEFDGRSKSDYAYAYMTLTVIEDYDGEKESVDYTYVYKEENGEMFAYELDRSGEEDVLVKKYKISKTAIGGAKAFKGDGATVYLSEVTE